MVSISFAIRNVTNGNAIQEENGKLLNRKSTSPKTNPGATPGYKTSHHAVLVATHTKHHTMLC